MPSPRPPSHSHPSKEGQPMGIAAPAPHESGTRHVALSIASVCCLLAGPLVVGWALRSEEALIIK
jgi:hypothetical protein